MRTEIRDDQRRNARFMMGISHDLKSPIGLIEGYAEAILDGHPDTPGKLAHFASVIKDRAALLEGRIRELIDLARLETGERQKRLTPVSLREFLATLIGRYRADASLFGHDLEAHIDLDPGIRVRLDPRLVERAIENLLSNSFRYAAPGTTVSVRARRLGPGAADAGAGSSTAGRGHAPGYAAGPWADAGRAVAGLLELAVGNETEGDLSDKTTVLFEPFWRDSSSRNEPRSSLGLSIARSIIRSHGWERAARAPTGADERRIELRVTIPLP